MVNIEDNQEIWFAGEKMKNSAFVSVRLMGNAEKISCNEVTEKICDLFDK